MLYCQEKQFSNLQEQTGSASTARFGNVQNLIAYLRESQLYGGAFIYTLLLLQLGGDKHFLFNFLKTAPQVREIKPAESAVHFPRITSGSSDFLTCGYNSVLRLFCIESVTVYEIDL